MGAPRSLRCRACAPRGLRSTRALDAAAMVSSSALSRYVRFLQRYSFLVSLTWLAIFAVGIVGVTRVFANLKLQARAPASACLRPSSRARAHACASD